MTEQNHSMTDALAALTKADSLAHPVIQGNDARQHVLIPNGYALHDITDPNRLPPHPRGQVKVDDRASLVTYSKRHATPHSVIFADYELGTISTRFDWHPHNQHDQFGTCGPRLHTATLKLLPSEEFTRWNAMQGKMHSQADFALFLEENAADIWRPEPAIMLELARDLEGVTGQTFKSRTRLTDGSHGFKFETENKIVSEVQAPDEFNLSIPVYHGEEPEVLTAKFRWRPTADGLLLGFVWHRVEYMRRARFTQIAAAVAEDTGLSWIAGRSVED
ncbi:MAG: DUF2303 family protein [Tabrizicola sp.]|nr:DUF2303 family protein [Tabrizicola sp.]